MPAPVDQALVYLRKGHTGPGTHVLLIGIGSYPYLLGGGKENADIAEGMEQLASPPASARALANWFLDSFDNSERPLASLALLLSEPSHKMFRGKKVPRGTINDIETAVDHWVSRASSDGENQTIFFFAGHGLSAPSVQLLMRDYGAIANNRFAGAMNFDAFRPAMGTQAPGYQLFLIEACRSPDSLMRSVQESQLAIGRNVLTSTAVRSGGMAKQSVHHAAAQFSPAFARTSMGLYTEAIIRALDGGGATANYNWRWVSTDGLDLALAAYTPRLARELELEQNPQRLVGMSFKIHRPPQPVRVPVYVSCAPEVVWENRIQFEAKLAGAVTETHQHDPAVHAKPEAWSLTLPVREHLVSARFDPDADYMDVVDEVLVVGTPETSLEISIDEKQP